MASCAKYTFLSSHSASGIRPRTPHRKARHQVQHPARRPQQARQAHDRGVRHHQVAPRDRRAAADAAAVKIRILIAADCAVVDS